MESTLSLSKILGQRIRRAREREGLAQAELAAKLGVTPEAIARWEAGGQPKGVDISKLEAILGPLPVAGHTGGLGGPSSAVTLTLGPPPPG